MKIEIQALSRNWVEGTIADYKFNAKIFMEPSKFGLNNGRVSKLWVRGHGPNTFINYDRGWDAGEEVNEVWEPLVAALEQFAQTAEFRKSIERENPASLPRPEEMLRELIQAGRRLIVNLEDADATCDEEGNELTDIRQFKEVLDRAANAVR